MEEELIKEIVKVVSFVPGVLGLAPANFNKPSIKLEEKKWNEGISLLKKNTCYDVVIAIFVDTEVNAKIIVLELNNSIKSVFKNKKVKLCEVIVNIRGVK